MHVNMLSTPLIITLFCGSIFLSGLPTSYQDGGNLIPNPNPDRKKKVEFYKQEDGNESRILQNIFFRLYFFFSLSKKVRTFFFFDVETNKRTGTRADSSPDMIFFLIRFFSSGSYISLFTS